jgi:hypothetical protein
MPLTVNVTRGFTFVADTPITIADFNAAALPNITITGSVGASDLEAGAVTATKVKADAYFYAAAGGSSNAYTASITPAPTSLITGMTVRLSFSTANTGAATLNLNSLGAQSIRKRDRQALEAGDIAQYVIHELVWDGTYWLLQTEPAAPRKFFPTSTGSTNAYEVTLAGYTFNAVADLLGLTFAFRAHASNTAAATLNVNGKGAVSIKRHDGTALQAGDIALDAPVLVMFDGSNFRALNVIAIATPPTAAIEAVTNSANGTATALATGTTVASGTLTLPAGKTWKHVRVTFSTWLPGGGSAKGIENFVLKNGGSTVTAPNSSRGTYASNNTDNAGLVVVWEWVPSGGAESGNLTIDVLADLPGAYSAGDEPGNRKLVISGLAQ